MSQRSCRSRAVLAGIVVSLAGYGSAAGQGDGKIPITTASARREAAVPEGPYPGGESPGP